MHKDISHWARVADEWIEWARHPNHDAFWAYRDALVNYIGPGISNALEVGCGEGRISRELKALGYLVTATDPVPAMIEAAADANSADRYIRASGAALPFKDNEFDLVVTYNVLMDVEDVPATLKEISRVMRPSATLVVSLVHPLQESISGSRSSSYFGRQRFDQVEARNGMQMHFGGWSLPLQDYAAALENAGLAITSLREPTPDLEIQPHMEKWTKVPLFLWIKARTWQG